jgi:hypothetical protein
VIEYSPEAAQSSTRVPLAQSTLLVLAGNATAPSSHWSVRPLIAPEISDLKAALLAFTRALLKLTKTIEARIPMMAITIRSSMSVKPLRFFFHILTPFLFLFLFVSKTLLISCPIVCIIH